MTDIFVDSGATGAADGTSKADAYVTLAAASGSTPGAGDRILCSHTHSEAGTSTITLDFNGSLVYPVRVISIDYSDDSYTPGASVRPTGTGADINITGKNCLYEGMALVPGDDILIELGDQHAIFIDCIVGSSRTGAAGVISINDGIGARGTFINCEFEFAHSSGRIILQESFGLTVIGGFITNVITTFADLASSCRRGAIDLAGVDLTNATNVINQVAGGTPGTLDIKVRNCKLNASYVFVNGDFSDYVDARAVMSYCESGTITTAAFKEEIVERQGKSITTTARYRTGGADDGEQANAVSQEMTALANQTFKALTATSIKLGTYSVVNGVSTTFKVHGAHNGVGSGTAGALQTDEFYIALLGPSEKATSDAQGEYLTNKPDPNATISDLPIESGETWNGTNVGTKQSDSITYTPEIEGFVEVWVFLATGSASDVVVNVCPKIEVS